MDTNVISIAGKVETLPTIVKQMIGNGEVNSVNLRDVWKFVESKSQFSHWVESRLRRGVEGVDYTIIVVDNYPNGAPSREYVTTVDYAKSICMLEDNAKGDELRRYFVECEKIAIGITIPALTLDSAMALANQAYQALLIERAEKDKAIAQAAYQDKALTSSQVNNAKLTRKVNALEKDNHKLTLACAGQLEHMTIKQFMAAVGIISKKNTNTLVSSLSDLSQEQELEVKKIVIGDEKWPSKAFQAAFLNENIDMIRAYFK